MSKRKNVIAEVVEDVTPSGLQKMANKDGRIEIRATTEEKKEIQDIARSLGLSVAEYLLALHRHAHTKLRGR